MALSPEPFPETPGDSTTGSTEEEGRTGDERTEAMTELEMFEGMAESGRGDGRAEGRKEGKGERSEKKEKKREEAWIETSSRPSPERLMRSRGAWVDSPMDMMDRTRPW